MIEVIKAADAPHLARAQRERDMTPPSTVVKSVAHGRADARRAELDAVLESEGVRAAYQKAGMSADPATLDELGAALDIILDLKRRVKALEERPAGLKYTGTWDAGRVYAKDEGVTHSGSLWVALSANVSRRPPDSCWQLCAKRGADGKSAPQDGQP